jgi:FAD/FMN-containing dehydrogenase
VAQARRGARRSRQEADRPEAETVPQGWELRFHPSTRRTATIGGFIAGGSGGVGSINYGGLRERGNVAALRLVTMEREPHIVELRGDEVQQAIHAYGTNGIITELEVALAPAWKWVDLIVACPDIMAAIALRPGARRGRRDRQEADHADRVERRAVLQAAQGPSAARPGDLHRG